MTFNVVGFLIGALCALILYIVGTAIFDFRRESLVFAILALILWIFLSFSAITFGARSGTPRR